MDSPTRAPEAPVSSRRAILLGAIGGLGAWAAGALGRATPVQAADGEVVNVGDNLTGASTTTFNVTTGGFSALWGNSTPLTGGGVGVRGDSASNHQSAAGILGLAPKATGVRGDGFVGVKGAGTGTGVQGIVAGTGPSTVGVYGFATAGPGVLGNSDTGAGVVGAQVNNGTGVIGFSVDPSASHPAPKPKTGVYGESKLDAASRGVWGASATGAGVRGDATSGIAVQGQASSAGGYAFRGSGRVRFDKVCGVASLAAGTTSRVITPGTDVTADSFVLLTPGADIGSRRLWFTKDTTKNTITIRMSSSRTSATPVSWLLLR